MPSCRSKRGSVVDAITTGIAKRGFYILPTPEEIPACHGDREAKLRRVQEFARENSWQVTVHKRNGWLFFTPGHAPVPPADYADDMGQLVELIDSTLRANGLVRQTAPDQGSFSRFRE